MCSLYILRLMSYNKLCNIQKKKSDFFSSFYLFINNTGYIYIPNNNKVTIKSVLKNELSLKRVFVVFI